MDIIKVPNKRNLAIKTIHMDKVKVNIKNLKNLVNNKDLVNINNLANIKMMALHLTVKVDYNKDYSHFLVYYLIMTNFLVI